MHQKQNGSQFSGPTLSSCINHQFVLVVGEGSLREIKVVGSYIPIVKYRRIKLTSAVHWKPELC